MNDLNCNGLNATECLLRVTTSILEQLKEDSSEFNWDPASFVVTLVIGIIAAAFAFFAIIQGFLAAGPGRHKCSKYAIGTWASISRRKFDWSELRYRSIAHTPIISIQDLVLKMGLQTIDGTHHMEWEWRDNGSGCWNQDRLFPKLKHVTKEDSDYFPATWLRLLTHTGLHHPELWRTNPQGTDYLPSDLAAAPAYSTVADLISIASITAGKIRFNSFGHGTAKDASMRGEYMDLNFRSHPLLGVYAVIDQAIPSGNDIFERHDMGRYHRPSAQKLLVKLAYGQGFLLSVQHLQADREYDPASMDLRLCIFGVPSSHGPNIIRKELDRIDSWIKENQQEDVMVCRIMALAFTTAVCKEMYQGDQRGRRWPIECDITPGERHNIDETISYEDEVKPNSLEAVTDLIIRQVQKLRRYEQNRRPGTLSVNDYFTKSCKDLHKFSGWTPNEKPFRFLEYMEHITKLWEKDKNDFKYPTKQVQHYLDDILVYRATLIYMVISQATDNSHILTNPENYKLIPVI
ncbi:hypothetical protein ACHAPD_008112 [Fusarium lateritium]